MPRHDELPVDEGTRMRDSWGLDRGLGIAFQIPAEVVVSAFAAVRLGEIFG